MGFLPLLTTFETCRGAEGNVRTPTLDRFTYGQSSEALMRWPRLWICSNGCSQPRDGFGYVVPGRNRSR